MKDISIHNNLNESFQFYGKDYLGIDDIGIGILTQDEYLKRKSELINLNKNQVSNIVESDINILGNKNTLIKELGEILNSDWKEIYKTQSNYGVEIFSDGSFTPRNKPTEDIEWIERNKGKNIVDIANTNFDELPQDWKQENIDAAESALSYFIRHFNKSVKLDNDFIDQFSFYNHNEWLKRNPRVFEEKKGSDDFYKDYNESVEKEKDVQISKRIVNFYAEKLLLNYLGKQLHLDWLEVYKTQESDGVKNYQNGTVKPRLKETKDEKWIKDNGGINIVDIANTDFEKLPQDWKQENLIASKETLDSIYDELSNGVNVEDENIIEKLASENHELWKKRNQRIYEEKNGALHLAVKYFELDEKEKEKNRVMITRAIDTLKENGLLYEYKNEDNFYLDSNDIDLIDTNNLKLSEILPLFKNEDNRVYIIELFNSYLLNNSNEIEKLKSEILDLEFQNLLIFYRLLNNNILLKNNTNLKKISEYIEEKYDNNLLFRYFRYFSKTRFEILKEDIISEKNEIIEKYGSDFYSSEGKDFNLRYISNDIIAFSDENKNVGVPLFYYKIIDNNGKTFFKKILSDDLFNEYSYFKDMDESGENDYKFLVQILHNPLFLKQIEEQLGFNFKEMPFYLQPRFMKFLSESSLSEFDRIKSLFDGGKTREESSYRLHSFLGTYENKEFSEVILKLGESNLLNNREKDELFKKYSDLLLEINNSINEQSKFREGYIRENLFTDTIGKLNHIFKTIEKLIVGNNENLSLELNKILNESKKDFMEAGIIFKNIKNLEINSLKELDKVGIDYKKINSIHLNSFEKEKLKNDLMKLYYDNYSQYLFLIEIEDLIEKILNGENEVEFYMFYLKEEPILSCYFEKDCNNSLYFGGFNGSNLFKRNTFGFWVLEKILEDLGSTNKIYGGILTSINGEKVDPKIVKNLEKMYEELLFVKSGSGIFGDSKYSKIIRKPVKNKKGVD